MRAGDILRSLFPTEAEAAREAAASEAGLTLEQRFAAADALFRLMVSALAARGEPLYGPEDAASEREEIAPFLRRARTGPHGHA